MALMVVLFAEIETLRQRVKDKEKEVQEVRRSSLAPFKAWICWEFDINSLLLFWLMPYANISKGLKDERI